MVTRRTRAATSNRGGSCGYQLQPYEKYFDENDINADGTITGGGDEDGNVWHDW